jgi:thiol-disulfide isomerase/thioredoxin
MLKQKLFFTILVFIFTFSATGLQAQSIEVIKFPQLQELIEKQGEQVKVINFWATWCRPCVKELPYFEELQSNYKPAELQVYLINLDDVEKLDSRVKPFVEKQQIKSTVKLLDETDYNSFIDKVDPSWSGAIPATLIIAGGQHKFVEGELSAAELQSLIKEVSNL